MPEDVAPKPLVFISFSSDDSPVIRRIVDLLEALFDQTVEFFWAPRHAQLGVNWIHDIEVHLRRANCVLAFISDAAAVSQWVILEAGIAYGLRIPFIPLAIRGYRIQRHDSPLTFLQGANVRSAADLNDAVTRLASSLRGVSRPQRLVTPAEFEEIFESTLADTPPLEAHSLLTRQAVFKLLRDLIEYCHFNAEIRAMTTIHSDVFDDEFTRLLEAVAKRCGTALTRGGRIDYRTVYGFESLDGVMPEVVRSSLAKRFAVLKRENALSTTKSFVTSNVNVLDILLMDREHAVIAFSHPENADRLQYGIHFTGYELVNPLVNWFDAGMAGATLLRPEDFLPAAK